MTQKETDKILLPDKRTILIWDYLLNKRPEILPIEILHSIFLAFINETFASWFKNLNKKNNEFKENPGLLLNDAIKEIGLKINTHVSELFYKEAIAQIKLDYSGREVQKEIFKNLLEEGCDIYMSFLEEIEAELDLKKQNKEVENKNNLKPKKLLEKTFFTGDKESWVNIKISNGVLNKIELYFSKYNFFQDNNQGLSQELKEIIFFFYIHNYFIAHFLQNYLHYKNNDLDNYKRIERLSKIFEQLYLAKLVFRVGEELTIFYSYFTRNFKIKEITIKEDKEEKHPYKTKRIIEFPDDFKFVSRINTTLPELIKPKRWVINNLGQIIKEKNNLEEDISFQSISDLRESKTNFYKVS